MILDICFSAVVTLASFGFGLSHPNTLAGVYLCATSALAWAVGSTVRAPARFNSSFNIIAAGFAAAAVGFSAPHA